MLTVPPQGIGVVVLSARERISFHHRVLGCDELLVSGLFQLPLQPPQANQYDAREYCASYNGRGQKEKSEHDESKRQNRDEDALAKAALTDVQVNSGHGNSALSRI